MDYNKEYLRMTEVQLREFMEILDIEQDITREDLKKAYKLRINENHPDKGGDDETAKMITRGFRVIQACLINKRSLPARLHMNVRPKKKPPIKTTPTVFSAFRSDDEEDGNFETVQPRFRKPREKKTYKMSDDAKECINRAQELLKQKKKKKEETKTNRRKFYSYINNYTYDDIDDFDICTNQVDSYDQDMPEDFDPEEDLPGCSRVGRNRDCVKLSRTIRGGLKLFDDLSNLIVLPEIYIKFASTDMEEEDLKKSEFEPILKSLKASDQALETFSERIEAFVYLDWAWLEKEASCVYMENVELLCTRQCHFFDIEVPEKFGALDEDFLGQGDVILVRPRKKGQELTSATAIVEEVYAEPRILRIGFFAGRRYDELMDYVFPKGANRTRSVDLLRNNSAFQHRTFIRAIENVRKNEADVMKKIVFPTPEFNEPYDEFYKRQTKEIQKIEFSKTEGFNDLQKRAIHTILNGAHGSSPFILWGPPGTGKTVTLIESVHQIFKQSPSNRVLICTPSRMAADVITLGLIERKIIPTKYIFRMHSQSANARERNKKLDSVVNISRESHEKLYGIPHRKNLRVFRVIISTLGTASYLVSAGGFNNFFSHIMIDEAGQSTEQETWIPIGGLSNSKTKVVLCGDPEQLGPVVTVHFTKYYGYDRSMISRLKMMDCYQNDKRLMIMLEESYRANYNVIRPSSYLFYEDRLHSNVGEQENEYMEWSNGFPIIFHSSSGSQELCSDSGSYCNVYEVELVKEYVELIMRETGTMAKDIGIISPYKYQVQKLKFELRRYLDNDLTIDSVEGFQGSERKVIIITTSRTFKLGFLGCNKRLNTSISRAKCLLIVVGTPEILSEHEAWKKFIYYCSYHGGFVDSTFPNTMKGNILALGAPDLINGMGGIILNGSDEEEYNYKD